MKPERSTADINIHLRARPRDRMLIDRAAELVGANRSQFMLVSAVREAKRILLDQTSLDLDAKAFRRVLDWMDAAPASGEAVGMKRLLATKPPWPDD